jgi:hypothetical protein
MDNDTLKKKSIAINEKILELIDSLSDNIKVGLFYPYKNEVDVMLLAKILEVKVINAFFQR